MPDDLTAFITARLDEDEDYARTMIEVGERNAAGTSLAGLDALAAAMGPAIGSLLAQPQVVNLMERYGDHGPGPPNELRRILSEVAAKRAILAMYTEARAWSYPPGDGDEAVQEALYMVICHLAAVYRDHPDYRQEWAPAPATLSP